MCVDNRGDNKAEARISIAECAERMREGRQRGETEEKERGDGEGRQRRRRGEVERGGREGEGEKEGEREREREGERGGGRDELVWFYLVAKVVVQACFAL